MTPASLSLWLNVSTNSFGNGPFDPTAYFAPLQLIQGGQYVIDIYYVAPTGNASAPWSYYDPMTYLSAAGLAIGNRADFTLYNSTGTFTRLVDQYGAKARFILNVTATQLSLDLADQASLSSVLQATWSTVTPAASPTALLSAIISKILGASSSGGVTNTTVWVLPNITNLTGSYPAALAGLATAFGAINLLQVVQLIGVNTAGIAAQYQLQSYTGAQSLPGIVLPNDYNAITNPVAWVQIS